MHLDQQWSLSVVACEMKGNEWWYEQIIEVHDKNFGSEKYFMILFVVMVSWV